MSSGNIKFLNSGISLGGRVGVGATTKIEGPQGPMGPPGNSTGGYMGLQGYQGFQGFQGSIGFQGVQGSGENISWFISSSGTSYPFSGVVDHYLGTTGSNPYLWNNTGVLNVWDFYKLDSNGIDRTSLFLTINSAVDLSPNNVYLTLTEGFNNYGTYKILGNMMGTASYLYITEYVINGYTPYITTGTKLELGWFVNSSTGLKGDTGQGFKVFASSNSYTGLNDLSPTGGNIGEFVLITGGDLFVYMGTGVGSTGPLSSYEYAGDVTDESKLIGFQGFQGSVGFQGDIGFQGLKGDGGSLPTGTYYGDYLYWNTSTSSFSVGGQNVVVGQNAGTTLQQINAVAIGLSAGTSLQGTGSIAIGRQTGQTSQGEYSVGIGYNAAGSNQKSKSISIGYVSGQTNQQSNSIAIGTASGNTNQLDYSIGIGYNAGNYGQNSYSIGLGYSSGQSNQGTGCIAIGYKAGTSGQLQTSIAIGDSAGFNSQGMTSIAIGTTAGYNSQGNNAIAIGRNVGYSFQGENSIAIGNNAGVSNQGAYSIILNTTGTLNSKTGGFYVNPIRIDSSNFNLFYNPSTKEISYSTGGSGFQGAVGPTGSVGSTGSVGPTGAVGSTGSIGSTGAVGPTGPAGAGGTGQWISSTGGIIYYSSGSVGINKANPTGSLDVVGLVSMSGSLNITGNISYTTTGSLINPTLQNYRETVNIGTSSTSSYVINCSTGNNFNVTLATATTAFTFINVAPTGTLSNITLFLTQDNSGGRLATFPSSVSWGNPSTPVLSTAGNAIDILSFSTFTGGSKWFGFMSGRGF
jgi:hypothetical protein